MKNYLNLFYLITLVFVISSCTKEAPIGLWPDNIKLSTKDVAFNPSADSVIIKTEGEWWWVTEVSVDTSRFSDFEGIDILSDNYTIIEDCFVVERRDKYTLFIKLDENPNSIERVVFVELEAGDYFDRVKITQAPK